MSALRLYRRRVAAALAWRPEWPIGALVAVTWLILPVVLRTAGGHPSHELAGVPFSPAAIARGAGGWALMCFAMMVPATLPAVRHVAINSIRTRRRRAVAVYVAAYLSVWMVFGALAAAAVLAVTAAGVSTAEIVIFTLALATAWQLTRTKRRSVIGCKRTVALPPEGWRADFACARFGLLQSWRCLVSCWPLMLLMAVVGHQLMLMILLTLVVLGEERFAGRERALVPLAGAFAVATVVSVLVL